MKLVNKSCEILNLSDVEAINLIRNDKIDIIVDLMGVTSKNRLSLIKNRVAPDTNLMVWILQHNWG